MSESNCVALIFAELVEFKLISLVTSVLVSIAKHSLSSYTTRLISGLWIAEGLVHNMAISRYFQTESTLYFPCSLESTMDWISLFLNLGATQWRRRVKVKFGCLLAAGCPVISSSRMIPKLNISLPFVRLPELWNL